MYPVHLRKTIRNRAIDTKIAFRYTTATLCMSTENTAANKEVIEFRGIIEEALPAAQFRVKLENGHVVMGHIAGKLRMNRIRLMTGDEVRIQLTPYDLTKGRIVYRY